METINLLKTSLNGVVGLEIGALVGGLTTYITPKTMRPIAKAAMTFGSFLVSQVLIEKISGHIENIIDSSTELSTEFSE